MCCTMLIRIDSIRRKNLIQRTGRQSTAPVLKLPQFHCIALGSCQTGKNNAFIEICVKCNLNCVCNLYSAIFGVRTEAFKKVLKHELPTGEVNGSTKLLITLSYASGTMFSFVNGRNAS